MASSASPVSTPNPQQNFTFDAENHIYRDERGVVVMGVTEILQSLGVIDYGRVRQGVLEVASDRGDAVHLATAALDLERLDWGAVPTDVVNYLIAYERVKEELQFVPRLIEHRGVATVNGMQFGYTIDREGVCGAAKLPLLAEIKCTASEEPSWRLQLAGYESALPKPEGAPRYMRAAFQLFSDATFKVFTYDDRNDAVMWQACLALAHWKRNHGLNGGR